MANRLLAFARLAYEVSSQALPERAHRFAPKRYTQPQLLACPQVKDTSDPTTERPRRPTAAESRPRMWN